MIGPERVGVRMIYLGSSIVYSDGPEYQDQLFLNYEIQRCWDKGFSWWDGSKLCKKN